MPRQNRVTPFGEIISTPARGTFMGNRGCLHDESGNIRRNHNGIRWIICLLEFKGRKRPLMMPGKYTELFFHDEAVALAAGHRPCAECQRDRFNLFKSYWAAVHDADEKKIRVDDMDSLLHKERLNPQKPQINLDTLPTGAFITLPNDPVPYLVHENRLFPWRPEGYGNALPRPANLTVNLLTPPAIVTVMQAGFSPHIHPQLI